MTKDEFYEILQKRLPQSNFILNFYTASREPCSITCNQCGRTILRSRADSFLQRARDGFKNICKYCDDDSEKNKARKTLIYKIQNANKNIECLQLDFKNRDTVIQWRCKKCNFIFERSPSNFLVTPRCPQCEGKFYKMTIDIIKQKNQQVWGEEYTILSSEYNGNNSYKSEKILVRHNDCGFCWSVNAYGFLYDRKGCPRCAASKPEKIIRKFLQENGYNFDEQVPIEYKEHIFRYDFVIEQENKKIFIEFHGDQHYKPVAAWGGKMGYEKRIIYDKLKEQYCNEHDYFLIILRNSDLSLLSEKLAQRLNSKAT